MSGDRNSLEQWHRGLRTSAKWPVVAGLVILAVCGGSFALWAGFAPLSGAVVAPGVFVATGQNKLVQHLEGGIVRELRAREGDLVDTGEVLVRMDETAARTKLRRLVAKKHRLVAIEARLRAEMAGEEDITIPARLMANGGDAELDAIFERQRSELRARRNSLESEELVLRKEIAGIEESVKGYEAQAEATRRRVAIFNEELRDKTTLLNKGLTRKTEVLALRRAEAGLGGELGELNGRIADANERIARAHQRIVHLRSVAMKATVQELREVETELDDVHEQIAAAQDVVERLEVRAPARGVVVKLNVHTPGAVVAPGSIIIELLPIHDELIIEAQIKPSDVSHVHVGQEALVRLSALNQRVTPTVLGNIMYLSADALTDSAPTLRGETQTRRDFYVIRCRLDQDDVALRLGNFRPTPGMPAEVYVKTGERTFFDYIMRPVLDSFSHAFRES
jgi:HlyD family secretion protein